MFGLAALTGLGLGGGAVLAQIDGPARGVTPIDNGGAYEVTGVAVDISGKTAEAARLGGWRIAQRKGLGVLAQRVGRGGMAASDGLLDSLVSGLVVENEQIGPNRYVARLGVSVRSNARGGGAGRQRLCRSFTADARHAAAGFWRRVADVSRRARPGNRHGRASGPAAAPSTISGRPAPGPTLCC